MKKKNNIRTPSGFLYAVIYILIYPLLKLLFRLKVDRSGYRPPNGPFIVLSNHQSFMYFLLTMLTVYPRRLNAVAAQKFFFYRPLNILLPVMGCIPKNLFDPDPRAIIGMMNVVRRGGSLLMFPEGRCATDGAYTGIHKATGKLIKKLNVPVISCHIEGAYVCMPLWRKGFKFGRQRVTLANLFSAEDTQELTIDEINRRIDNRLSGAETAAPQKPFRVFRAKQLTKGLENILYYCPSCGREFTLETSGNTIHCTACGNTAAMDCEAKLTALNGGYSPETVHKWFREQVAHEARLLREDWESVRVSVNVRMPHKNGGGLVPCGRGELFLDRTGWHYNGELSGVHVEMFFPIETVPAVPFDPNDNFQIYSKGSFYAFTPVENPRACVKYAVIGECAYWRCSSSVQMTQGFDSGFAEQRQTAMVL